MPLFTKTFAIIASLLSVPVFGLPIIGSSYASPFHTHLADLVNGGQTATVVSTNAPNWAFGFPLPQVVGVAATATSTDGTLASSTAYTFAVSALDGTGTTTISATVTATTDGTASDSINVSWSPVPGAKGYVVWFATSSNATSFTQYFIATSTNSVPNALYNFATSSGSVAGSYSKPDTTAFSVKINPSGTSYLDGGSIGVGTTSPLETLDVASGTLRAIGAATSTCNAANAGAIQYQSASKHFYGCLPSGTWDQLDN